MQKNRRIEIIDLTENLNLIGYSMTENRQLKNIDEVAEFICKNGKRGDVTITNNGEPFITTIPYLFLQEAVLACMMIVGIEKRER